MDYSIFYKTKYSTVSECMADGKWDLFLSAYNETERVRSLFESADATDKVWAIQPQYQFAVDEYPKDSVLFVSESIREDDFGIELFEFLSGKLTDRRICIDLTGFMRPHLMFLIRLMASARIARFDALYSEPSTYTFHERTTFTYGAITEVRPVAGFEGLHDGESSAKDLLVIAAGYEHDLIRAVAYAKENARKIQMLGFPPLQPDFYQENVLRSARASEAVSPDSEYAPQFAPASDPFVTARALHEIVEREKRVRGVQNLYIAPLSTRPQALGFALYHLHEGTGKAASVLYPFAQTYARDTSRGVGKVWKYSVELPHIPA